MQMKRFNLLGVVTLASATLFAQTYPESGYYRVQSVKSGRYISIIDAYGKLNMSASTADMGALRTYSYSDDKVVSNPAAVIYADHKSGSSYDLQAQGTGAYAIVGHVLQLQSFSDGTYGAYASMSGITKYLYEYDSDFGDYGGVGVNNFNATNKSFRWNVLPISSADATNFFGIKPDVQIGSDWYKSFYASFPFNFASSGMKAYYVTKIDAARGLAVYEEVSGSVPAAMPVFVKCSSAQPTDNRLDILTSTVLPYGGNQLKGQYFCCTPAEAASVNHVNCLEYDESTMRVLGVTAGGSLGFVKAPDTSLFVETYKKVTKKYMPANTAYLVVPSSAPAELKLVTKEEYETYSAVTVTARSYTRVYGDENPAFEYDADGTFSGQPELKCEATKTSPVGTYPITVSQGTVTGTTITGVAGTLTITAAPLTVTAQAATREYGEANPDFTFTYSGWKNGETDGVLTTKPTVACAATAASPAGQYDITVGGGAAQNYALTYVPAKLTVSKAPLKVKADDKSRMEGTDNPELTVTYTGFKNNETASVLDVKPTVTTTATKASAPGTYPITVSGGSAKNYELSYENGTLTVQAGSLTITAKSITREYGEVNPKFEYEVSGTATLRGTPEITCTATKESPVGTYDIIVSKGTVENENVTFVKGTLTITKAPLKVKADDKSRLEGADNPELTVTYTGFKNNETASVLDVQPTVATTATKASVPGTYPITVSGGSAKNYELSYENGTLTVQAGSLTITAKSITREYGEVNPKFEYEVSGTATLRGTPEITCSATKESPVGTYDIIVGKGTVENENVTFVKGTLTITKARLTAAADNASREYGDANPSFSVTYTGFKNNDNESVLTTKPKVSTTADAKTAVGTVDITLSGAAATNYEFTYVAGKLTITAAPLKVKADDKTRLEGTDNPELTVTYTGFKNNETASVLDELPTVSTTATKESAPGAYPITVTGGSAKNYTLSYENGTLNVVEGDLILTALSYEREYGEENPVFEFDQSGTTTLKGVPAITCEATKESPVGTYDIVIAKGTVENGNVTYVNGTLTITKAPLTVTADDATREKGTPNPAFTLTYSGWKNGEDETVLDEVPVAATEADEQSDAGDYEITVSGGSSQNYEFIYVSGRLTVTPAPLIIIVDDYENMNEETLVLNEEEGTAEIIGAEAQNQGDSVDKVEIPENVSYEGQVYSVTKIAESAFENMTTLETVVIPQTIEEIGANAFAGCEGLTSIFVNIQEPISLTGASARGMNEASDEDYDPVFAGVNKDVCMLYVPLGCAEKYRNAPVWNTFKNIEEIDIQGICDTVSNNSAATDVYSLSGMKVLTGATTLKSLPVGIYVVNGKKVMVK